MTEPELVAHGPAFRHTDAWPWWARHRKTFQMPAWVFESVAEGYERWWPEDEDSWTAYHAALTADGKGSER